MREILNSMMTMAGIDFTVSREGSITNKIKGFKNLDQPSQQWYIACYPDEDIKAGDILIDKKNNESYQILSFEIETVDSQAFQGRAFYTSNLGRNDIAIKSENSILEKDAFGIHELRQLLSGKLDENDAEVNALLNLLLDFSKGKSIKPGILTPYKELLSRNLWLTAAVNSFLFKLLITEE